MKASTKKSTRATILDAALGVMAQNPGASLAEVAAEAGVGRTTLYRYFSTREALVAELALTAFEEMSAAVLPVYEQSLGGRAALEKIIEALAPLGDRFHFLWSEVNIYHDETVATSYTDMLSKLHRLIDAAKAEGAIAPDISSAWAIAAMDSLIWAAWVTVKQGYLGHREAPALVIRSLFQGLAPGSNG